MQSQTQVANPKKKLTVSIILLLIFLLAAFGAVLALKHHTRSHPTAGQPYAYNYGQLDNYKLDSANHSGVSIQKPVELKVPNNVSFSQGQILLLHNQASPKGGSPISLATLGIASMASAPSPTYLDGLNKALESGKLQQYQPLVDILKKYVTDRAGPYDFKFDSPQKLVTDNIKTNAFNLNFTATPTASGAKYGFQPLQGRGMMAFGTHGYYFITISSINYNWSTNSKVWDQVINSMKIDQ